MLGVTDKSIVLSVIMLNVVAFMLGVTSCWLASCLVSLCRMFWRLLHDHLLMIILCFSDICSTKNQEQISWSISLETPPVFDSALVPNNINLVPNKVNLVPNLLV
jgi:hypothetical protein